MASTRLKGKIYQAEWLGLGNRRISRTTKTGNKKEAGRIADEKEAEYWADLKLKKAQPKNDEWLAYANQASKTRAEIRKLAPKTIMDQRRVNQAFADFLPPGTRVCEIDLDCVENYYNHLIASGLMLTTARKRITEMNWIFKRAVAEGICDRNPVAGVEFRVCKARKKEPFTKSDVALLFPAVKEVFAEKPLFARDWETLLLAGWCLGQRIEDIRSMNFEDMETFSEGRKQISFVPSKTNSRRNMGITNEKLKRKVTLPIVEPLASHLEGLPFDEGSWFPALKNVKSKNVPRQFLAILKKSGVKYFSDDSGKKKWRSKTFHSFRYSMSSHLNSIHVPERVAMRIVDHDSKEAHKGYVKDEVETIAQWMDKLDLSLDT